MGYNWLALGLTFVLVQIFLNATDCRVVELDVDASEEKFEKLTPQDFRNGLQINISDIDPNSPDPVERWKEEKIKRLINDNSIFELFILYAHSEVFHVPELRDYIATRDTEKNTWPGLIIINSIFSAKN